ncbi:MAG: TonB family protein [Verrucomicrobia bacterium]|nr:TonB family protein [Verrucomicrobiota bacterium]MBU4290601.1 TonB family protein [Verrucomicrobiota bacterium]MBU4428493.1 TonB family protein [Verrucomicrobiota bacterium]MCG2679370.1 TonB family protein [Kiritimatiellia bacterium]
MSVLAQRLAGDAGRLKAYVLANPFARKAILSAGLHAVIIIGLLLGSLVSCHVRAPRDLSPFDLQSIGQPGKAGGAATVAPESVVVSKSEDGLEIVKKKPVTPKRVPVKTQPKKPVSAEPKKLSQSEIQKLLGSVVKDIGSGSRSAVAGTYGTGSGGGTYDPLGWYYSMVRVTMYEAWQQPSSLAGKKGLISRILIRVQRDGRISQRSLIQPSGNALMDSSVMTAVESVQRLQELPPGFGGSYKEITIDFELTETPLE